ncbi:hypothetical protein [Microbacterium sp. PA5]|uniref:hypothetical protein n=1 Tax=Microbacterium sp. PA5 TaxID=3416654 RepID=UPI003CF64A67
MSQSHEAREVTQELAAGVPQRAVSLAYGPTRSVNGAELIPVALVTYGFGGSDESQRWGVGGGGGGVAIPLGAYVSGRDGLRFRPNPVMLLGVAIPLVLAVGHVLHNLVRRR